MVSFSKNKDGGFYMFLTNKQEVLYFALPGDQYVDIDTMPQQGMANLVLFKDKKPALTIPLASWHKEMMTFTLDRAAKNHIDND